ncbi:SH3 domain-containing protein, partial [Aquibacillus halophilus]
VFSNVVPFGSWLAYYYDNTSLKGLPKKSKVIAPTGQFGKLSEDNGTGSPASGIPVDNFSAKYTTAKRITAGNYILRTKADDGVRVYLDGKLILDRWNEGAHAGEAIQMSVWDRNDVPANEKDIHLIEVQYREASATSSVDVFLEPYEDAISTSTTWIAEFFPNEQYSGNPIVMGGNNGYSLITSLNYNWAQESPHPSIPVDNFSARFTRKINIAETGTYVFEANADDGVRVTVDGQTLIDSLASTSDRLRKNAIYLQKGSYSVVVEYKEILRNAWINLEHKKISDNKIYYQFNGDVHYNWGIGQPNSDLPADNFTGLFESSRQFAKGDYFIQSFADDGVRVKVDDQTIIDRLTSFSTKIDRALWLNAPAGTHSITTEYQEISNNAGVFTDVVPFGSWLAYYYDNKTLNGLPKAAKVISSANKLTENFGTASPAQGIPADQFSAKYSTAKRLPAGSYIIRTSSDDGVRVSVDGNLVVDRWSSGVQNQESIQVQINDKDGSNVHWIDVEYFEETGPAEVNVEILPYIGPIKTYNSTNYNYTFNEMVDKQMAYGSPKSDGAGLIPAERFEVEYYANPTNFSKDTVSYLQFLKLSDSAGLNVNEINTKILANKGTLTREGQAFVDAGKLYSINEVYLIAHALHETGNGSSTLASGMSQWKTCSDGKIVKDSSGNPVITDIAPEKVYNMYGIGAYDANPNDCGAQFAYSQGWFNPSAAIKGGAQFVSVNYIQVGQNTLYKMKWNPAKPATHQYATHVSWALSQTKRIDNIYKLLDNYSMSFDEPKFLEQPPASELLNLYPSGVIGVTTEAVNFRSEPIIDSSTLISTIPKGTKLQLIGYASGWYQVKVGDKEGWLYATYVDPLNLLQISVSGTLHVRQGPGTTYEVAGDLYNGYYVSGFLDSNNQLIKDDATKKWYKINYKGSEAWIHSDYAIEK